MGMEMVPWVSKPVRLVLDGEQEQDAPLDWKLVYSQMLQFYRAKNQALASEEGFGLTLRW
jgi:hypothetical protein